MMVGPQAGLLMSRGTRQLTTYRVHAYIVNEDGTLQNASVLMLAKVPVEYYNHKIPCDYKIVWLTGWKHTKTVSFEDGRILVPFRYLSKEIQDESICS